MTDSLQRNIETAFEDRSGDILHGYRTAFDELKRGLNEGRIRAAEPSPDSPTGWKVNSWVKKGILLGFRISNVIDMSPGQLHNWWFDKSSYPPKRLTLADQVRVVPGGSAIRDGAYVGPGVVCMPPMYINVGAFVGTGTMVDSHALIGSCAQIGECCHISAASQIGGVLEPVGAMPVIIEDDVLVGGNCGVYEGTIVRKGAVLGTGTILNRSTPVYDVVRGEVYAASEDRPLIIPENAVVIAGSRAIGSGKGKEWGISLYTPVIVKYRDEKTDAKIQLEDLLR